MILGKWKLSSRRLSTTSSEDSDMTTSSSSTRAPTPTGKLSSGGNSNSNGHKSSRKGSSSPFSWFRSSRRSSKRKSIISRDDPAFARLHKPFTQQNLEHQKMLSTFEWTFHDSEGSQRRISLSLSPCASRNATVDDYAHDDYGYGCGPEDMLPPPKDTTLSGPLARLSIGEAPDRGYEPRE
ncbi:hypothetical protein F4777DRAFT_574423 [Nemania sp. FL0916]|nr:hypothetical protein F4777DRAFT_574423 [Nemania sp. FL0916]